jgi:hypothetical protein
MIEKSLCTILVTAGLFNPAIINAQSSWTTWNKYPGNPVYSNIIPGGWNAASDPSVIKDGAAYIMVLSGTEGNGGCSTEGNYIVQLTSSDGVAWDTLSNGQNGIVIAGCPGDWDESMEMPEVIKVSNKYALFYCGYDPSVAQSSGGLVWGDLGLAESTDGIDYTKIVAPVMSRTPNWYDQDGITDPTIIESGDTLYMIYVGWCTQSCSLNNGDPAFYSLKAISTDNGHTWIKQGLLDPTGIVGLQHPDLVHDADGKYSLFFGVDNACSSNTIGLFHSVGNLPFGPFLPVSASPAFCMGTQGFETLGMDGGFPTVINDNGVGKMWYTGVDDINFYYKIGLAESNPAVSVTEPDSEESLLRLFPNPAQDKLQIDLSYNLNNATIRVYNRFGQNVKTISHIDGKNVTIETAGFSNGLYFLQLQNGDRLLNGKFTLNE